ncbi:alpha/beta fold hydrolase [Sphingorhabdus sp.]|uniref:alpha/beta fold hydrolase n=1 Tax=Sphingorhabdus sp. TaxID=1902408 RepID=UPI00391AFF54
MASRQFEGSGGVSAESYWVQVAGGQLHVRTAGVGPLVIFLHGWTLDWRIWLPQMALLGVRMVMPDRRGFGQSTAPPSLAFERDDVLEIADHFGADDFSLVGLSQGAAVALDTARHYPERVRALSLIGAPLHHVVHEPADAPEIDRAAFAQLVRAGKLSDMLAQWQTHTLTQVAPTGVELLQDILADYDGRDQLVDQNPLAFTTQDIASLPMPVLAIAGAQDSDWRKQVAHYIGSHVPHGQTEIIADAGHLANVDQAGSVNWLLQNFLNTHFLKEV